MEVIFELIKLAAVGVTAGLFSSWLTTRDHRTKKWWELKVEVYQNLIDSFSDLVHYYAANFNAIVEHPHDTSRQEIAGKQFSESYLKIQKEINKGTFLLSKDAVAVLYDFKSKEIDFFPEYGDEYVVYLDKNYEIARKCLDCLVECSKSDLELESEFCLISSKFRNFLRKIHE